MRSRFAFILTVAAGAAALASGVSGMIAVDRTLAEAVKPPAEVRHDMVLDGRKRDCDRDKSRESRERPASPEV